MGKTKIDYCHETWNAISGCRHACEYCYAIRVQRQRGLYGGSFEPQFHPDKLRIPSIRRKPSIFFPVNMGDVNSPGVEDSWRDAVYKAAAAAPRHRFIFLTKNPQEWIRSFYFPPDEGENIWLGTSITNVDDLHRLVALDDLDWPRKYIQFEPLLGDIHLTDLRQYFSKDRERNGIKWIIVGGATNYQVKTRREWVARIISAAQAFGIPIFVKDNAGWPSKNRLDRYNLRQFPEGLDELAGDLKSEKE